MGDGKITVNDFVDALKTALVPCTSTAGIVALPTNSTSDSLLISSSSSVVAAGTTQAAATTLTKDENIITSGTGGVVVQGATTGKIVVIINRTVNTINVYPASGHYFDGLAVNIPIALPANGYLEMYGFSNTQWNTTINAVVNWSMVQGRPTTVATSGLTDAATTSINTFTGNQTAPVFISNVVQGTAPLTVTSTTVITNLNADMIDGKQASGALATVEQTNLTTAINEVVSELGSGVIFNPVLAYGMNGKITNASKDSQFPVVTFAGQSYTNLFGKDGNCEDISKWTDYNTTHVLDTSNKVYGSNSIKVALMYTNGSIMYQYTLADVTKYYCFSAWVKNGNLSTSIALTKDYNGGGVAVGVAGTSNITNFTRLWFKMSPGQLHPYDNLAVTLTGASGQYGYVDGVMLHEITSTQYADGSYTPPPYVDSYACLQNPYTEIRHDNLVRNGNCEEGIGYYNTTSANGVLSIVSGAFQLVTNSSGGCGFAQKINVKPNTNYYIKGTITGSMAIQIYAMDNFTFLTNVNATFNTGSSSYIYVSMIIFSASLTGTASNIMLVEGTTAPAIYLPFRQERQVLEGMFTSDDSITTQGGKITGGQRNWKHSILFGKDYDWQYDNTDFTGFKRIVMVSPTQQIYGNALVKYDGKIMIENGSANAIDNFIAYPVSSADKGLHMCVTDTDTGWGETIAPNNDEAKAFMNGWKAVYNNGTRYGAWVSIIDGSAPSSSIPQTIITVTTNSTVIIVPSGLVYAIGDYIGIVRGGAYQAGTMASVTAISATTVTVNITWTTVAGDIIIRADIGNGHTENITYCKNNIAPNYQGYQLHYKLANPEILTDDNTHIHGDIPKLDVGDNYVYLDSGIVLGEVANPLQSSTDSYYYLINGGTTSPIGGNILKYTNDIINTVYKNSIYDNQDWTLSLRSSCGTIGMYREVINSNTVFDSTATYTVDYKILSTIAPQIGSVGCSYSQDVFTAIQKNTDAIEGRQQHDSALDTLTDLSIYEVKHGFSSYVSFMKWGTFSTLQIAIPYVSKKTVPSITIDKYYVYVSSGSGQNDNTTSFSISGIYPYKDFVILCLTTSNSAVIANMANGVLLCIDFTVSCRGRV